MNEATTSTTVSLKRTKNQRSYHFIPEVIAILDEVKAKGGNMTTFVQDAILAYWDSCPMNHEAQQNQLNLEKRVALLEKIIASLTVTVIEYTDTAEGKNKLEEMYSILREHDFDPHTTTLEVIRSEVKNSKIYHTQEKRALWYGVAFASKFKISKGDINK